MANGNIRGITISIDGDTSNLNKALKSVDGETKKVQTELKQVEKLLKFDPKNVDLLAQKQDLLSKSVSSTADKLGILKQAQAQVEQQFKNGENGEEAFRKFQREIIATEGQLKAFKNQANNTKVKIDISSDGANLNKLKKQIGELGTEAKRVGKEIGTALGQGSAAASVGIGALVVGSTDLNNDLARLRTNATIAGRDLGVLEQGLGQIVAVTGETDSAVETLSNLLASGFSDNQMAQVIDQINGAAIKFSDTLKTEGIADGIQETFATGEAIGMFAELLERSGVDVDKFNDKLAKAKKEGTETNLALETLSKLGLTETSDKYKELNGELLENNKSTLEFQKAMADLAIVLTPLVTAVAKFVTKIAEWAAENETLARVGAVVITVIGALFTAITVLYPIVVKCIEIFNLIRKVASLVARAFVLLSNPIGWAVLAIAALIAIGVALYKNWETVSKYLEQSWIGIQKLSNLVFTFIGNKIKSTFEMISKITPIVWNSIKTSISTIVNNIKTKVINAFEMIKSGITKATNKAKEMAINAFDNIKTGITSRVSDLVTTVKGLPGKIISAIGDLKSKMFKVGGDVVQGLIDGITGKIKALAKKAKEIGALVEGAVRKRLDTHSPSKVMVAVGKDTGDGFELGLENSLKKIKDTAIKMGSLAANAGGVLNSSVVKSRQQREVQQVAQAKSQNIDLSGLVNAVLQLANNQPDVKLYMDGREVSTMVDRQQYNSIALASLTKGVTI